MKKFLLVSIPYAILFWLLVGIISFIAFNEFFMPWMGGQYKKVIIVPKLTNVPLKDAQRILDSLGLNLLQRIRDEAHRFALSYHRILRKKVMIAK